MVKVSEIAFIRFAAPDLVRMERFLTDFGLVRVPTEDDALYMRGSDRDPWIHQTVHGEAGYRGVGFSVERADDLERASRLEGASSIEDLKSPGGGACVHFVDPDGFSVEIVHGREPAEALETERALPLNSGGDCPRIHEMQRVPKGPARVRRLGHAVVHVSDFSTSAAWYQDRFGFLFSDEIFLGAEDNLVTAFMRCDRGSIPADHHTFLCLGIGPIGFDHAAFEVEDFDAIMTGHGHLEEAGHDHHAGVGRHILGSHIFDYWKDPWGHTLEHFTDGDLFDATREPRRQSVEVALGTHWGHPPIPG
ncbi:MAG: glyoxalase [bacterium]|nr:glyoxalase [Deltaproteobacteria bacterium]MCP4907032.1 glyoxalase [bacterium]